jgi:hypothetical protein
MCKNVLKSSHYEKSHPSKPHYPTTKTQKITHIQLLYNYPLSITTIVQLSPKNMVYYYTNCHVRKLVSYIIVASELKMGLLYLNLYTLCIHM